MSGTTDVLDLVERWAGVLDQETSFREATTPAGSASRWSPCSPRTAGSWPTPTSGCCSRPARRPRERDAGAIGALLGRGRRRAPVPPAAATLGFEFVDADGAVIATATATARVIALSRAAAAV